MATTTDAPPAGLTGKALRAWKMLGEHEQRMAERRGGLRPYHCGKCGSYLFDYVPPIGLFVQKCRECGDWYRFTTEQR